MNTDGNLEALNRRLFDEDAYYRQQELLEAEKLVPELEERVEKLEDENRILTTSGIIEVAVRNPSVMDYMKHWEGRVETLEHTLLVMTQTEDALKAKLAKAARFVAYIAGENTDHVRVALAGNPTVCDDVIKDARATLAEIGESHG